MTFWGTNLAHRLDSGDLSGPFPKIDIREVSRDEKRGRHLDGSIATGIAAASRNARHIQGFSRERCSRRCLPDRVRMPASSPFQGGSQTNGQRVYPCFVAARLDYRHQPATPNFPGVFSPSLERIQRPFILTRTSWAMINRNVSRWPSTHQSCKLLQRCVHAPQYLPCHLHQHRARIDGAGEPNRDDAGIPAIFRSA